MEDGVEEKSKKIAELAPVVGAAQGDSIVDLIEGYEELARDASAPTSTSRRRARGQGRASRPPATAFTAAVEAKPGLTALAISPYDEGYAVAVPEYAPGAARLPDVGPGRHRPEDAGPGVPVLADAELREGRHLPARPAAVRRPQLPGQPRDARERSRSRTASRPTPPGRTRPGRPTGCTPTRTTPSS